jgi:pyruvate,orthophosphate dikinase
MYGNVVLEVPKHDFDEVFDGQKKKAKAKLDTDLTAEDLKQVIVGYKKLVRRRPASRSRRTPRAAQGARDAVFGSWFNARAKHYRKMNQIPDDLGTAVNVQAMVFGNMGETSATGVGFTRNPATGEKVSTASSWRTRRAKTWWPASARRTPSPSSKSGTPRSTTSSRHHHMLEKHYRDIQDFEFTIQDGKLYMLQTRNGKRTGPAAVRIAVEMVAKA